MSLNKDELSRRGFLAGVGTFAAAAAISPSVSRAAKPVKKIKVGQIGVKHAHARGKMESLRKLTDYFEVVGVVEPDDQKWAEVRDRKEYKRLKRMSAEQLLNTKGLEAVAVETRKRNLVANGMLCAKAGMHIHLDKPAGQSLSEFKALLDEMTRQNLTLQMGYMFRNNPAFQFCFEAVKKGWLGRVFEIDGVISKTKLSGRPDLQTYPGGTMFELGCHLIDAMVAVMGAPDKVTSYKRQVKPEMDNLYDNCMAVFEYKYCTATIRSALVEVDGGKRRQFVVCGDEGTVDIHPLEPPKMKLALSKARAKYKKGYQDVEFAKMSGRYDDLLIDWALNIRGEKAVEYPPSHDLAVHKALLEACGVPLN